MDLAKSLPLDASRKASNRLSNRSAGVVHNCASLANCSAVLKLSMVLKAGGALKRFNHNQDDDQGQDDYWQFVKPAVPNMAAGVAVVLEVID